MAQDVSAAWTAEERDSVRNIAHNLQVSWKKETTLGNRTFTIGVSLISGNDVIGINPGAIGSPANYKYFDESDYIMGLSWERSLNLPMGGLSVGFAEADLDNTTDRYTPRYLGGTEELFTAILPRRPMIINAGFEVDGIDQTIPQFSGVLNRSPKVFKRNSRAELSASDYVDFFSNRYLDQELMFTGLRTDEVYEQLLISSGLSTAQYSLDTGINVIPFGAFDVGTKYSKIFHELAEAENGQFYQDEEGKFRFENRQHYDSSPHTDVQRVITTGQVIDYELPDEDHIINVVEVKSTEMRKQPAQTIMNYTLPNTILPGETLELFFNYENYILEVTTPTAGGSDSYWLANSNEDGTGTDYTSSVSLVSIDNFAQASKLIFKNNASNNVVLTKVVISGRPVKDVNDIYVRLQDDSSVTAYEERPLLLDNKYIQNEFWANSYAQVILNDYSDPENIIRLTIRAIPELQLGDLISWQGRYWRTYGIKTKLDPSYGFVQELQLVQRTPTSYFRIGISTIGGDDVISP